MEHFAAVKILHDIKHRMVYNLYTEFLRLLGIYIGEGTVDKYTAEEAQEDLKCFQFIIYIADKKLELSNDIIDEADLFYVNPADYEPLTFSDLNEEVNHAQMRSFMEELSARAEQKGMKFPDLQNIQSLLEIYFSCNILKGSYHLQYYRMENPIHEESEIVFGNALNQIESNCTDGFLNDKITRYAKLYCKQKKNLACFYQKDKVFIYSVKELSEECLQLIKDYPEFSNAWVLLGMIYEKSHDDIKSAIEAYYTAIEKVGDCCYSAHIFYWIANLYEKYTSRHIDAKYAYEKAYNHKKKYRNIYKLAKMAEYEEDYEVELEYYSECLQMLDKYREILLDPLEMEYYYKTGVLACFKYINIFQDYEKGIRLGLEMERFYNNIIDNSKYFKAFYGSDANKYQQISMSRISLRKLYECLAIAYREIGQLDKSQEYWQVSEKY